eukprot:2191060-Pleurochrysis_carterae.AAC.1
MFHVDDTDGSASLGLSDARLSTLLISHARFAVSGAVAARARSRRLRFQGPHQGARASSRTLLMATGHTRLPVGLHHFAPAALSSSCSECWG